MSGADLSDGRPHVQMLREWVDGSHEDHVMTLVEDGSFIEYIRLLVDTLEEAHRSCDGTLLRWLEDRFVFAEGLYR